MNKYSVTCAQMKILEQNTDAAGLSYYQMMENAGTIAAHRIVEISKTSPINDAIFGPETGVKYAYQMDRPIRARVYCGKGNNGGDGFVVARLLRKEGWDVELVLVDGEPVTPDAIANYRLTQGQNRDDENRPDQNDENRPNQDEKNRSNRDEKNRSKRIPVISLEEDLPEPMDVIVDAIYGTGFHGRLRENGAKAAAQIAEARARGARVFALDIPSGMGGDLTEEKELDERCVRADVTITFHAKKIVHLQPFASKYCGEILVADIGIVDPDAPVGESESDPFRDFVEIISRLRAPSGCPWDREQTHQTLKKYLLEETQELAEAIDNEDDENFCEELGDVLLQIVLHAQIARERGAFDIDDVIRGVSDKMVRRHPWVFGDMHVETPAQGEQLWEQIKAQEKAEKEKGSDK